MEIHAFHGCVTYRRRIQSKTIRSDTERHLHLKDQVFSCQNDNVKKTKTYNRRDSQMVTHSSTSRPVQCLCMAERTGCPVFTDLWSYVLSRKIIENILLQLNVVLLLHYGSPSAHSPVVCGTCQRLTHYIQVYLIRRLKTGGRQGALTDLRRLRHIRDSQGYCLANKIRPCRLPSHTSHKLQRRDLCSSEDSLSRGA